MTQKAMIYKNCIITHESSKVKQDYSTGSAHQYNTGIDLFASQIYCPCRGVVVQTCYVDSHLSVIVQYSENIYLRFTNLLDVFVSAGDLVLGNQLIGEADKYVHFEYLTSEMSYPYERVYITQDVAAFKHDPRLVLEGNIVFDNTSFYNPVNYKLYGAMREELSDNRGV